jgi:hypothetical protein
MEPPGARPETALPPVTVEAVIEVVRRAVATRIEQRLAGARRAGHVRDLQGTEEPVDGQVVIDHPAVRDRLAHELGLLQALSLAPRTGTSGPRSVG